jgi:hypothetical protein
MAVDLMNGSASDAIKQLLQTSYDRSSDLYGKSEGLSPEALSAFRTQATYSASTISISPQRKAFIRSFFAGRLGREPAVRRPVVTSHED